MHVTALIAEQSLPPSLTIRKPTWEQVLAAIGNLDGKSRTTLVLEHSDEDYMTIGGRWRAVYVRDLQGV